MEVSISQLSVYSIGIVAANKKLNSKVAFITPLEITPFMDGELDAIIKDKEVSGVDSNNDSYQVKVSVSTAIEATWLPYTNTNRRTAPDLRRGERVLLWRYSDSDEFYWTTLGMDDNLRKLETVIYTWGATRDESKDSTLPENSYSLEVCTHTKQVTFRTVKADGEPFAYTFQINAKEGAVTLTDDVGNYITLDSTDTLIRLENIDGTWTELNKEDINAKCNNRLIAEVGNFTHITCPVIHLGENSDLEPSVLGDKMAAAMADLISQINASQVIGNLGIPTSAIAAVRPVSVPDLLLNGNVYSKKNKNQ